LKKVLGFLKDNMVYVKLRRVMNLTLKCNACYSRNDMFIGDIKHVTYLHFLYNNNSSRYLKYNCCAFMPINIKMCFCKYFLLQLRNLILILFKILLKIMGYADDWVVITSNKAPLLTENRLKKAPYRISK
jgi:hypothetical protein